LDPVRPGQQKPADIYWVLAGRHNIDPQHVAILSDRNTLIHAIDIILGVREHIVDPDLKIEAIYRFRGIVDA
jgi:hypothetical protein